MSAKSTAPKPYEPTLFEPNATTSRPGLYYGWVMVALAAIAMAATLPGRTHGLGLVTKQLLADFPSISQDTFGVINFWATIIGALFCLPCGWLADRFRMRHVAGGVMLALAGVVAWMSRLTDETSLLIAITLSRGIGQSMLSVVSITMVGKWFQRRMGVAMGTYAVLMSLMMAVGTGVVGSRVAAIGWRAAWFELAIGLLIATPILWIFTRTSPRDLSIEFADDSSKSAHSTRPSSATWQQAVATPCFWVFAIAISLFGMVSSGVTLFQELIFEERGLSREVYITCLMIGLFTGMIANLAVGGLARRFPMQWLLAGAVALFALATAAIPFLHTPSQAYGVAVVNGFAGGSITVLFFSVWGHAFGPANLGRIQAIAQMMTVLASALGPFVVARSNTLTGSYNFILATFALSAGVLSVAAMFTPVPQAYRGAWSAADETGMLASSENPA